jgi:glycine cleavage system H protein
MTDIKEMSFPDDIRYAEDHEWTRIEEDGVRVGISDYAQDQLGDITFVELPAVGDTFNKGDQFGTLESTKAVADLFMPVGGEIAAVNEALQESPELVNQAPYDAGWIIVVKGASSEELDRLMDRGRYVEMLEGAD